MTATYGVAPAASSAQRWHLPVRPGMYGSGSASAGGDQARLVRQHDQLRPVSGPYFGEDARDVGLYGGVAHRQPLGDLGVAQPPAHQQKDLSFPWREPVKGAQVCLTLERLLGRVGRVGERLLVQYMLNSVNRFEPSSYRSCLGGVRSGLLMRSTPRPWMRAGLFLAESVAGFLRSPPVRQTGGLPVLPRRSRTASVAAPLDRAA